MVLMGGVGMLGDERLKQFDDLLLLAARSASKGVRPYSLTSRRAIGRFVACHEERGLNMRGRFIT